MIDDELCESTTIPSPLCRWSIHVREVAYEGVVSPPHSPPAHIDLDDEESWPAWPDYGIDKDITQKLNDGLERNTFTNVRPSELPIAMDQIVRAVKQSPQEMHQEALAFGIMSRNLKVVGTVIEKMIVDNDYSFNGLYPFHLAIAYLDGSKVCCNILYVLVIGRPLRQYYVNDLGHTALDQIMITILKSHTSCTPSVVDSFFKNQKRFEGAEVDVCGRWDADSPCVRELLAKGDSSIPFGWKHMFCHTSVQAICHCIEITIPQIFVNTPSGLFTRHCYHCGRKLQLLPLHCLVMVGFHLSESGCKDENLFGILACLLCLLSRGADPRLKADISLQSLWGDQDGDECVHEKLDPTGLVESLLARFTPTWCEKIITAWSVIIYVLKQARAEWKGESSPETTRVSNEFDALVNDSDEELDGDKEKRINISLPAYCSTDDNDCNYFGERRVLATLWAAVTTEFLTYRRLTEDDAWLSQNFDMTSLNQGLNPRGKVAISLVEKRMMKSYCKCGNIVEGALGSTDTDDACALNLSIMKDWNRTTLIISPEDRVVWWYD